MTDKKKLDLHPKPISTIQLNRPLMMTISVVVVTVLLLAIVAAFTSSQKTKKDPSQAKVTIDKSIAVSPELEKLPGNYSDINAIKKYLPESENGQLAMLLRRFNKLQHDHNMLRRQLALQKNRPAAPTRKFIDPKTKQARASDLVFNGLGSNVNSVVGGRPGAKSRSSRLSKKDDNTVPTESQAALIAQQNANKMTMDVLKGNDRASDIYDMHNVITPIQRSQSIVTDIGSNNRPIVKPKKQPRLLVQAGNFIPATLITGIDTTLRGTVIAQVRSNVYDSMTGKYLLIPKGSKLLGQYDSRIKEGQRRFLLAFKRLVRPDGTSILLGGRGGFMGMDGAGKSGIEGNVDNHWARIIGASTISTILSVGASMAADSTNNQINSGQKAASGAAKGIADTGQQLVKKSINIQPTITLPPGHQFNLTVQKDMVLTQYKLRR